CKEITTDAMDAFGRSIKLAVEKVGQIADELDHSMIKEAARFADRAGAVANLIKTAVDALSGVAAFQSVPTEAFDTLFAAIKTAIQKMQDLTANIDTDMRTRGEAIATKSMAVFSAIKVGFEGFARLAYFKLPTRRSSDLFGRSIKLAVEKVGQIADELD